MNSSTVFKTLRRYIYYRFTRIRLTITNFQHRKKEHQYLFILSPPFCGSTLLNQIISSSTNVSCNNNIGTREGQTLPKVKNIMFYNNRWDNNVNLPWEKIKTIWHKYMGFIKTYTIGQEYP